MYDIYDTTLQKVLKETGLLGQFKTKINEIKTNPTCTNPSNESEYYHEEFSFLFKNDSFMNSFIQEYDIFGQFLIIIFFVD